MGEIVSRKDAAALGLRDFFTGDPCIHGHIAPRSTSDGKCRECLRERSRRHYQNNKSWWEDRHAENRDDLLEYMRMRYAQTKESRRPYREKYCWENREGRRIASAEWHARNRDRATSYRTDRLDVYAVHSRNRRAKIAGIPGSHSAMDVKNILKMQKFRCANCGCSVRSKYHVDHIVPIFLGGSNDRRNIQVLCPSCNLKKNKKDPIEFQRDQGRLL